MAEASQGIHITIGRLKMPKNQEKGKTFQWDKGFDYSVIAKEAKMQFQFWKV